MGFLREVGNALTGSGTKELREDLRQERAQNDFLEESLGMLEQNFNDDEGWRKLGHAYELEFTRDHLIDLVTLSRAMYMAYPLIRRGINVTAYYTWGQGCSYKAKDDQVQERVVKQIVENPQNAAELFGESAAVASEVDQMVDGSTFYRLKTDIVGDVAVRSVPAEEIRTIYTHPKDKLQVWFYERVWVEEIFDMGDGTTTAVTRTELYPDWRYYPLVRPDAAGDKPINWDEPIIHQKSGGLKHMDFGVPEAYAAFDWARAYKSFLENWHSLVASLSRFAWKATTKRKNVKRMKGKLDSEMNEGEGRWDPRSPAPGGVAVTSEGTDLSPIPKTGATTSAEDAKPSRLMVASALNIPDTMLSNDPQQGALATAKTLDRPTELYIKTRQGNAKETRQGILQYGILAKQRRNLLPTNIDTTIEISFPPILEHDIKESIGAIVSAATLDGKTDAGTLPREIVSRMLAERLGVDNIDEMMDELSKEEKEEVEATIEALAEAIAGLKNSEDLNE